MTEFLIGLLTYISIICWIYGILSLGKKIFEILMEYKVGRIILIIIAIVLISGIIGILLYKIYLLGYEILNYN